MLRHGLRGNDVIEKQCWHCRIIVMENSECERSKKVDKDDLKRLFYRNKTTLSFDKYVTNIKQTFNVIDNYNVPLYEEEKVRKILDNTNRPNNYLKAEFKICRSSHSARFETASIYL